jgi:hypothetical protein
MEEPVLWINRVSPPKAIERLCSGTPSLSAGILNPVDLSAGMPTVSVRAGSCRPKVEILRGPTVGSGGQNSGCQPRDSQDWTGCGKIQWSIVTTTQQRLVGAAEKLATKMESQGRALPNR